MEVQNMLKENEIEILIKHANYKHYEDLGYFIFKDVDKRGR